MKFAFIIPIYLFSFSSFAQDNFVIKGIVSDSKTRQKMASVSVFLEESEKGTLTDSLGEFELPVTSYGNYHLRFSCAGYQTQVKEINLNQDTLNLTVYLQANSTILQEVEVSGLSEAKLEALKVRNNTMPVTLITANQIENRAGNLTEVLARQAGVQMRYSGGLGSDTRISVRGLEGKRIPVFIDENPLNSPDGSLGINDIPTQLIERIEIYKGAVPAYLGGDGLGSAVNIVLRHRDVSFLDVNYGRESFNTQRLGLILKKTFDQSGIELGGGIFDLRSDNNYTMKSPYQPGLLIKRDHDFYHSMLGGVAIRFHKYWFDEIELEGAFLKTKKEIQGIQQNIQQAQSDGKSYYGILSLSKKSFANNKMSLHYNLIFNRFNVKFADTSAFSYGFDGSKTPSILGKGELGIGPNLSTNLQNDTRQRINLSYRINTFFNLNFNNTARYVSFRPNDDVGNAFAGKNLFNYPGTLKNSTTGLTLETRLEQDKLLLSTAVKHYLNLVDGYNTSFSLANVIPDKINNRTNTVGYNAGFRYNFSPKLLIKGSFERGVRLPNNTELFGDGMLITGNPTIKPELANNFNLGAIYDVTGKNNNRFQIEINGFYNRVKNLIQLAGNGLTLGYVNYQRVNIIGADLDLKRDVNRDVFVSANVTYQILKDVNRFIPGTTAPNPTYQLQVPNVPQLFANWSVEYHPIGWLGKASKTRFIYDGSYVNQYNYGFKLSQFDNFLIPSYVSHTLSIEQSFKENRYTITAEVNNISNATIINNYNQPLPGRMYRLKLRYLLLGKDSYHH